MADRERRWAAVYAHRERLLRLARARVDDPHDAEDCVQEAMVRCVEFRGLDEARLGQFLTSVTLRLCADLHRGRARRDRLAHRVGGFWGYDPGPEESVCDREESLWLSRVLADLSPRQRAIVEARAEGLSCGAVAERLRVPYTTVESALARVRRSLRLALDSTLGVAAPTSWLRLRHLLAGGAAATAALTFAGDAHLPDRPPARPPVARSAAPDARVRPPAVASAAQRPAPPPTSATPRRRTRAGLAAFAVAPVPAPPGRTERPDGGSYVGGAPAVEAYTVPHDYSREERLAHCVRYGVAVGRVVQCRYPPGDPRNIDEVFGTPTLEGRKP